jgi:excisionase family DNA binding protein
MQYLTTKEIADRLQVSTVTVKRYIKAGLLPAVKLGTMHRVDALEFENFLKNRTTTYVVAE